MALFKTKVAVPNDAGRAPPVLRVGFVGGFSCELVMFAVNVVCAYELAPAMKTANGTIKLICNRSMRFLFLL
jgi:hypothetical protein